MLRTSKHSLKHANASKIDTLNDLFVLYKKDLIIYINYIVDGVLPLGKNLSSDIQDWVLTFDEGVTFENRTETVNSEVLANS